MKKVVSQFGRGPLEQKLTVGDLHFLSDADPTKGGTGSGPSPHEYLDAALAACTSMILKKYAGLKSMNPENAAVTVDIVREDDVEIFSREIKFTGNLISAEKERLLKIADKCPIHKALAGNIQIKTLLVN
ncbi:OsmC family protein [Polynucleobacter necessarius]|uniref:OsmC family protein n=1 Tax=Polynucleobacter necessarius TaxID=576610 RepID=UPI000E08D5BF|nr:OsmC family protein [Polynucleobacter necessarius]HAT39801.1 osmotically inducible protein OsmC [Polynucleobacter sp.]